MIDEVNTVRDLEEKVEEYEWVIAYIQQGLLEEVTKKHEIDLEEVGEKLRLCIIMCVISFFPIHTY